MAGRKVLVLSRTVVARRMSSPGIRAYHIARVLAEQLPDAEVTLALPGPTDLPAGLPFRIETYDTRSLGPLVRRQDILVCFSLPLSLIPFTTRTRVVLDLYGVLLAEWLEVANIAVKGSFRRAWVDSKHRSLLAQLAWADLVLYANQRQRHLYLGMLGALGRVTPEAYAHDKELRDLLVYAPFGVRPGEPRKTRNVLKGVHPGIAERDKVLLWNGVVTEWYDTETLIRAVHRLSQERSDIKLFFLGTEVPAVRQPPKFQSLGAGAVLAALRLSEELGLLDRHVFFNLDWVDYDATADYLLEADAGVCTYYSGLETAYSMRTRLLDLIWAERPIVCTRGDALADLVEERGLGITVPPEDERTLADAIVRAVDDEGFIERCRPNLRAVREELRWERALAPLVAYCRNPAPPSPAKRYRLLPVGVRLLDLAAAELRRFAGERRARSG